MRTLIRCAAGAFLLLALSNTCHSNTCHSEWSTFSRSENVRSEESRSSERFFAPFVLAPRERTPLRMTGGDSDSVLRLRHDLDSLFSDTAFSNASFGVAIQSLQTGEYLYRLNDTKSLMPASNMKLFTTAEALALLGPEYRYKTELLTNGKIRGHTLYGDLIIRGVGDPSFPIPAGGYFEALDTLWPVYLPEELRVHKVHGSVIGEESFFTSEEYPQGWVIEDLPFYYAPHVTALSYLDNSLKIVVSPGAKSGVKPDWACEDDIGIQNVIIQNLAITKQDSMVLRKTSGEDSIIPGSNLIQITRTLGTDTILITGEISVSAEEVSQEVSVENPTLFTSKCFHTLLEKNQNIRITGGSFATRDSSHLKRTQLLATSKSEPLSNLVQHMNKESDNLYAECLFRTVAKEIGGEGSWTRGIAVMRKYLTTIGIDTARIQFTDGSGLSRMDMVTADDIVKLLRAIHENPKLWEPFYNSLPIAGVDGTLQNQLKGTPAQGNIHAKTGSMTGVRSISGYLTTRDGEPIAFSILANNYTVSGSEIGKLEDEVLLKLVNFSRR